MCLVASPSWSVDRPVTNSSMVNSPDSSMSSISQALNNSSRDMCTPSSFIRLWTKSWEIKEENSPMSNTPLPSSSAARKELRKNSMNAWYFLSCSLVSFSLRFAVAAIILFDATAVKTEIIVQEAKEMKKTKKSRHHGFISTTGYAISSQLSMVVNLNNVKSESGTFPK
eukprot:CAMPEP_0183554078 /NCGR_PEP_ID=MMETSP0371-20130417/77123_1 /TAXON_ID=268820 /ORGANISM="Peridinium aciculiferum, Strain PAER-2" /LENGTH=168 /DNA_ID=CAMNT_0025759803 /DNA_START=317 /DNA_END=823 /DNA_ORIENTATION=+